MTDINYASSVIGLAEKIMERAEHVAIVDTAVKDMARQLNEDMAPPRRVEQVWSRTDLMKMMERELLASAVNYRYWFGRHDVRPNNASASEMYRVLDSVLERADRTDLGARYLADDFGNELIARRFPASAERRRHLAELELGRVNSFLGAVMQAIQGSQFYDLNVCLELMIKSFPGFAEDMFLKRAFLFFHQVHRISGVFRDEIAELPIPADYQIPKILAWKNCIEYDDELSSMIYNGDIIQRESKFEVEIRSAAIVVCKRLAELTGLTMCDIDDMLFSIKNQCHEPFHLTITTDY